MIDVCPQTYKERINTESHNKSENVTLVSGRSKGKSKGIAVQAWTGPEGCRKLKPLEFLGTRVIKVTRLSAYTSPPPVPFMLHLCGRKEYVNQTRELRAPNAVP